MTYKHLQSGFSLVETLVAITILLVIIVGPLTLVSTSARSTSFASEQVVAFFLAQEGAELAQKARDDLVLERFLPGFDEDTDVDPWEDFVNTANNGAFRHCFNASGCGLGVASGDTGLVTVSNNACPASGCVLHLYASTNPDEGGTASSQVRARYTHTPTSLTITTPYTRNVRFEVVPGPNEQVRVISTVRWFTGSINSQQQVQVETYLFNIYGN